MSEQWQAGQTAARSSDIEEIEERQRDNSEDSRNSSRLSPIRIPIDSTSPSSTFRVLQSSFRGGSSSNNYTEQRSQYPRIPPFDAILDTSANNPSSRFDTGSSRRTSGYTSISTPSTNSDSSSSRETSRLPIDHAWRPAQQASVSSSSAAGTGAAVVSTTTAISGFGMPATPDLSRPLSASSNSSHSSSNLTPFHSARTLPPPPISKSASSYSSRVDDRMVPSDTRSSSYYPSMHQSTISGDVNAASYTTPYPSSTLSRPSASSSQIDPSKSSSSFPKGPSSASLDTRQKPSVEGFSRIRNGRKYKLIVVQHPTRARMCGFGDKDRRPLSPTLIVKLVVTDETTGKEITPWDVNTSLFFLASDLCHPDELILSPRNVLVHQHAASVPTAILQQQQQQNQSDPVYETSISRQQQNYITPSNSNYSPYTTSHTSNTDYMSSNEMDMASQKGHQSSSGLTTFTTEHYTRNLVGAAVTGANVLRDEQDVHTIFFVLQDLSIRTEGVYRIRLIFTDLAQQDGTTNEGISEALAEAYTEPFSVYSPRRFPGMLEPTELSKKLASQGIKIAVRSDKKKRRRDSTERESQTGESQTGGTDAPVDAAEEEED